MRKIWLCCLASILILLAVGCGNNEPTQQTQQTQQDIEADATVDMNTCSFTSRGSMVETENGYYFRSNLITYYADKSDLTKWVPLCSKPDCSHSGVCSASLPMGVVLDGNRIYTVCDTYDVPGEEKDGYALYSMAMDGTDMQKIYTIEESRGVQNGGFVTYGFCPDHFVFAFSVMQTDGTYRNMIVRVDKEGSEIICEGTAEQCSTDIFYLMSARGDLLFQSSILSPADQLQDHEYQVYGDSVRDLSEHKDLLSGSYIRGDLLFHSVENDGYYVTRLTDMKKEKRAQQQIQDAFSYHLNEQYIVETNFRKDFDPEQPQMCIYNGSEWKEVTLPGDFWPGGEASFYPIALSTECIFFRVSSEGKTYLYTVDYSQSEYTMTLCTVFG